MKTCPYCKSAMTESEEPNQANTSRQFSADHPPLGDARRVRYECSQCHHLESGYPSSSQ
jgi:hypothetical protein